MDDRRQLVISKELIHDIPSYMYFGAHNWKKT